MTTFSDNDPGFLARAVPVMEGDALDLNDQRYEADHAACVEQMKQEEPRP
jgi:hypothetical protein